MDRNRGCIVSLLSVALIACLVSGLLGAVIVWGVERRSNLDSLPAQKAGRSPTALPALSDAPRQSAPLSGQTSALDESSPTPLPMPVPFTLTPTSRPAGQTSPASTSPSTSTLEPTSAAIPAPTATPGALPNPSLASIEGLATRLVIPAMTLDRVVILSPIVGETWQVHHLDQQIGHLERTAGPGSDSNMVLAAHVTLAPDGRDGPFVNLRNLTPGDVVTVYKGSQAYTYRIDYLKTVRPTDIEVTYPSDEPRITLITCLNFNRDLGRYEDRLVAVGHLESGN